MEMKVKMFMLLKQTDPPRPGLLDPITQWYMAMQPSLCLNKTEKTIALNSKTRLYRASLIAVAWWLCARTFRPASEGKCGCIDHDYNSKAAKGNICHSLPASCGHRFVMQERLSNIISHIESSEGQSPNSLDKRRPVAHKQNYPREPQTCPDPLPLPTQSVHISRPTQSERRSSSI